MDKEFSLISCIVPTIGRNSLKRTLQSLVDCKYPNLEIIVVGDSLNLKLEEYASKINIIYLYPEQKLSPAENKNLGLKISGGKYVTFLDDDDYAYPEKFFTLSKFLDENENYFGAYGMYNVYDLKENKVVNTHCGGNDNTCFDTLVENNYIASGSIMLRNTKEVRFPEDKPYGFG